MLFGRRHFAASGIAWLAHLRGRPPLPDRARDVLARTLYGEARGQAPAFMRGVACVVLNRAHNPRWWGRDVVSVCLHPGQFSCWSHGNPNRPKLEATTLADPAFAAALTVATDALAGRLFDLTRNADSYYSPAAISRPPAWAVRVPLAALIDGQPFFRTELPAPRAA